MNNLELLADFLYEEMERLNEIDLTDGGLNAEYLDAEIKRAKAMGSIAKEISSNNRVALDARRYAQDYGTTRGEAELPKMLKAGT